MVSVLADGASAVVPMADGASALQEVARRPEGSCLLAGELNAETLPGFLSATPSMLLAEGVRGRTLVYATTNGTPAVLAAASAHQVFVAALSNARAVVDHVVRHHPDRTVLIVCAGSAGRFNLEDFYGAGYFVSLFRAAGGSRDYTDAALAAGLLHAQGEGQPEQRHALWLARVGRRMLSKGLEDEVRHAARKSWLDVVPRFQDGVVTLLDESSKP
ncbi:MAG: 2-phosphosulfolactate phosphatase, partial [Rhizobacter sp.]